jgi:hypothetical protein
MLARAVCAAILAATMAPFSSASAEQEITLQAEVVDPSGYIREGRQGAGTADLTYEAAEGGQSLALLDPTTGALYLLLTEESGEDPNELVYEFANQLVNVTGRVYQRGGMKGIVLSSVQPVAADAEGPAELPPDSPAPQDGAGLPAPPE